MKTAWIRLILWIGNGHRRMLAAVFALIGPQRAYRVTGWGARLIYRLLDPLRIRSEALCAAALHGRVAPGDIPRIAEQSFVNRARNLTDLLLASRLLNFRTYGHFGGRVPEPFLSELLEGRRRRQPTILVTAYYGSFDLLPIFLGYNGIHAACVYLPHGNKGFDAFRLKVRAQSGCEMVPVDRAAARFEQVLAEGGMIALIADHHAGRRGMAARFLGLDTRVMKSVGLLAWRYEANVVVAAIRRCGESFRFELIMADVVYYPETRAAEDPVAYITQRYLQALERVILEDPTQYLWAYARWGEDHARRAAAQYLGGDPAPAAPESAIPGGIGDGESQSEGCLDNIQSAGKGFF